MSEVIKIMPVFQLHELVTSEDLFVTHFKKKNAHILGRTAVRIICREQARHALSELPCGSFGKGVIHSHLN
jgi:hypothetical protein